MVTGKPDPETTGVTLVTTGTKAITVKLIALPGPALLTTCKVAGPTVVSVGTVAQARESLHRVRARVTPFNKMLPVTLPNPVPLAHWVPPSAMGFQCTDETCGGPKIVKPPETVTPATVTSIE